jgi:hypothetical protein
MKPDGGQAFPSHGSMGEIVQWGMTLRDYFAAMALPAVYKPAHDSTKDAANWSAQGAAQRAYSVADAMLAERSKP